MALRLAFVAAGVFAASTARAAPAGQADREETLAYVELAAPENCATREGLIDSIRRQSEAVRFVERARAERSLFAEIRPTASGFTAGFTLVQTSGRMSLRQITAKTCSEALEALTLLAALALDPREGESPPASPTNVEPPRPEAPIVAPPSPPPSASPRPSPSERPPAVSAGIGGLAALGPTPDLMPGAFLYVGGAWYGRGLWSPALRLTASHAERDGIVQPDGTAGFALDFVGLDLCPVAAGPPRWTLRACAQGTWGQFSSGGSKTRLEGHFHRPFGTLGGSVELSFDPGWRMEIVARVGAGVPLVRDSFVFGRPDQPAFYRVQPVTVTAGLGVGFRIL